MVPPIALKRNQVIFIGLAVIGAVVIGGLVYLNLRPAAKNAGPVTPLEVWGFEKNQIFSPIALAYQGVRPDVKVNYREIAPEQYEETILTALAAGHGPDVIFIGSHDMPSKRSFLVPAPPAQLSFQALQKMFPQVVEDDFSINNSIYALPFYIDTMALLYNKDDFDRAGLIGPPATWEEFDTAVRALHKIGIDGSLQKPAAAIGGSEKSVERGVDLLNLIMLQNGTPMTSRDKNDTRFAGYGQQAFNFYLHFANGNSPDYAWNDSQSNSIDAFAAGHVPMIFSYLSTLDAIRNKNPFLNIGVAFMPQIAVSSTVNYADYWGMAVTAQSRVPQYAWDFVIMTTTNEALASQFFTATQHPPALR
ncbi:MAG: extracellular solute-binding protein, partial [bacterium]|nr:extracellular solute-binding protein [bacterium]